MTRESREPRDQNEIVAALADGSASGDEGPLRRIVTHMSHVFLGPDRVYKLKRSVRHPFADMSSLEARRRACEAELAVNRALAPELAARLSPLEQFAMPAGWVCVKART